MDAGKLIRSVEFDDKLKTYFPAGRHILGTSWNDWHFIDPETGRTKARIPRPKTRPTELIVLTPDGRRAWLPTEDGYLHEFDAQTGQS